MICPATFPFSFAKHLWFVINKKGAISRWEVKFYRNKNRTLGYLHIDAQPPFAGILRIFPIPYFVWRGELLDQAEGEGIQKVIEFIENSKENYPYLKRYSLAGPNSNTYVNWVLKNFPELKITLPRACVGKDY